MVFSCGQAAGYLTVTELMSDVMQNPLSGVEAAVKVPTAIV